MGAGRPDPLVLTREDIERNIDRANQQHIDKGATLRQIPLDEIRNPFEEDDEPEEDEED